MISSAPSFCWRAHVCLCERGSRLAEYTALSMEQLRSLPLISQREEYTVAQIMRRFYTHSSTIPGRTYYVGDPESMTMQVYNDVGVTFIPESVVHFWNKASFPMAPGTRMIPMSNKICQRRLYLTYPQTGLFSEETAIIWSISGTLPPMSAPTAAFPRCRSCCSYFRKAWKDFPCHKARLRQLIRQKSSRPQAESFFV